ncbi:astacin-like metalloendopeptidase [Mycteria americana]|uniref:astacin-like metalloendopeptidase n=1 Tax=Mycteria americana TaxID=33587 RepID=UPI003F58ACEC
MSQRKCHCSEEWVLAQISAMNSNILLGADDAYPGVQRQLTYETAQLLSELVSGCDSTPCQQAVLSAPPAVLSSSFPINLAPSKRATALRTELQSREDHLGNFKMKYFLLPTHLAFLYSFALSKPVQIATRNNDFASVENNSQNSDVEIAVYEGDILLRRGRRSAINCESCLWPKSQDGLVKVPINISSDFSVAERSWIDDALQEISTLTCVQFVNRTTETDYVYVERGQSCWSYFGKIGGRQAVGLVKNGCMDKGAIQHEMNHALGFIHEQARSDRDRFVKIMWEHIVAGEQGNFGKVNSKNLGLPYDYSSVMHYGAYDFSSTPGKPTIVPVPDPSIPIGQREGLSNLDVAKINKLYKCNCCSSVLSKSKGSFSSVNYPSPYPNNSNCLWLIRIHRSKIFLQFEAFDLQPSSDCSSDYIKIYNGNSKNSPVLLDKYCGKGPLPSLVASGSTMLVEFASDDSITATGFRASYHRVNCGDTFTDLKGVITSPNYPNKYPQNQACFWVISSPVGYKISLKMLSFELEDSDRCIYDYLLIHDGSRPTSPAVGPYCGTEKVADFTSTGNFVLVEFHSDIVWELPGFMMSYTFGR